jgi:hypothetical protein
MQTHHLYLTSVEQNDTIPQVFRVEWSPQATGDTCFYPIAFPFIHHGMPAGIISLRISGLIEATDSTRGDKIMFWQSHPWPRDLVAKMDTTLCMKPVY